MKTQFGKIHRAQHALTLTELLVVLAIIGLLATIAIPVYMTRMETARIRTAQLECRELAHAEEQCAIFHSFYVPLQLLDNLPADASTGYSNNPPADSFANETLSNLYLIDPFRDPLSQANAIYPNIGGQYSMDRTDVSRVADLLEGWQGPFLNAQRIYVRPTLSGGSLTYTDIRRDFPLDPWGQPYRFFSPVGPIGTSWLQTDVDNMNSDLFSDGRMLATSTYDFFDRYAIVSLGPNQVPEGRDGLSDDIYYEFGTVFSASTFYRYYYAR